MQRKGEGYFDRGPGAIGAPARESEEPQVTRKPKPDDRVYVFSRKSVSGYGVVVPAMKFFKVKYANVRSLKELAKHDGGVLIDFPIGFNPKDAV